MSTSHKRQIKIYLYSTLNGLGCHLLLLPLVHHEQRGNWGEKNGTDGRLGDNPDSKNFLLKERKYYEHIFSTSTLLRSQSEDKLIFQKLAFGLQWMLQTVILQNQYLQTKVSFFFSFSYRHQSQQLFVLLYIMPLWKAKTSVQ